MIRARPVAVAAAVLVGLLGAAIIGTGAVVLVGLAFRGATSDTWGRLAAFATALFVAEVRPRRRQPAP